MTRQIVSEDPALSLVAAREKLFSLTQSLIYTLTLTYGIQVELDERNVKPYKRLSVSSYSLCPTLRQQPLTKTQAAARQYPRAQRCMNQSIQIYIR